MNLDNLFAKIDALLDGIDRQEDDSNGGWWQTSDGANVGRIKLRNLKGLLTRELAQPEPEGVTLPVAYIHRQGNHWEVSERPLYDNERNRGWTDEPLYTRQQQPPAARVAQPEPEGLTDEKWDALKERLWDHHETVGYSGERFMYDTDFYTALDAARQELARYGRPAVAPVTQPEPEGVFSLDDLRDAWNAQADAANSWDELGLDEIIWFAQQQALARYSRSAVAPVAVADRQPTMEAGDLDDQGRCWWGDAGDEQFVPSWRLCEQPDDSHFTHWRPYWAIPMPTTTQGPQP